MVKLFRVLCFGEVLWDNLPSGRRIGGAPLNVCYHLNQQGLSAAIISQVGDDKDGQELCAGMSAIGIPLDFVVSHASLATSTVEVQLQSDGQASYRIVENVAWDALRYRANAARAIAQSAAFVFGSLATRMPATRKTLLLYLPSARWVIFDMNLRAPYIDQTVVLELLSYCHTLKVNEEELYTLADWLALPAGDEKEILEVLWLKFPKLKEVLLTKGAEGASHFSQSSSIHVNGISVLVKDTIGSGDSFLATFIAQRIQGSSIKASLQRAVVVSAFVASQSGACPSYSPRDV